MIHVGTSGWQYDSWKKKFYAGEPKRAWLAHYASRFPVVEVNNSFYQLPKEQTFDRWKAETPDEFQFAVKASRYITHIRRLRDCRDPVKLFWSRATHLGDKLGPVLFQFPPNFGVEAQRLREFLTVLPQKMRVAFEFRDDSWRTDEVLGFMDDAGAAWVLADRPGWQVPLLLTGGWSYVRFHQGRATHPGYTRRKLLTWAEKIAGLDAKDVFVFFNNDQFAAAPRDAETLTVLLLDRGLDVATALTDSA
ncbi:MAG TPA: DUF72 domain-containing protein [Actinomycetota bacterium]|jgi:uncharacterized protein YecE (DUF72 family)